jgi:cyclohexadieny/prephenate dehydrogenase
MTAPLFQNVTIIGFGLIGSSLARDLSAAGGALAGRIVAVDRDPAALEAIRELQLADLATDDIAEGVRDADLVVLATPVSAYAALAPLIGRHLKPGAILSDVGSVKMAAIRDLSPHVPAHAQLVPGHPIAGTENSGPRSGLVGMYKGRWTVVTPTTGIDRGAVEAVKALWRGIGSEVVEMSAEHHDKVLAITSHLPHLIAYTIVGTAVDLEASIQAEVIKFSASGFRDFTRIAASDPTMWRDIFLNNREAVLEMLQRLTEDLAVLQRAIRNGDGDVLFDRFSRAREIRRGVIAAKQA